MIVHPELRALRGDDSPQCDAQDALQQALAHWQGSPDIAAVIAELEHFAAGGELTDYPALADLFTTQNSAADRLSASFSGAMCAAIAANPLGHVPLRHFTDGVTSTILLARAVNVTLSLVSIDGEGLDHRPQSATASFGPHQTWEHVLGGSATVELVECRPTGPKSAEFVRREATIGKGSTQFRDGTRHARLLRRIDGTLVSLRLQRRSTSAGVTREYDLTSGALLHQAAGNPRDSRIEMMLALLGRMRRADAAPVMAELALGEGSTALRWQALRECLALDTLRGFLALAALAADPTDSLAGPAGALRAQLLEAHPQLKELEPCPA